MTPASTSWGREPARRGKARPRAWPRWARSPWAWPPSWCPPSAARRPGFWEDSPPCSRPPGSPPPAASSWIRRPRSRAPGAWIRCCWPGPRGPCWRWPCWAGERGQAGGSGLCLLGRPEDLVDLRDLVQQLLGDGRVVGPLGVPCRLGRLPEQLVELWVALQVVGLEVVGPEHPQVVLDQVGPLFLDGDGPGPEVRVLGTRVLLHAGLDRLGFDAGLGRVVDPAWEVAVSVHRSRGIVQDEKNENQGRDVHAEAPCQRRLQVRAAATLSRVARP